MEFSDCIRGRRSVRRFSDREIDRADIERIVDMARYSPSWKNSQTVRYHVVLDGGVKGEIARGGVCGFERNTKTIDSSRALVVVTTVTGICGYEPDGSFTTAKGAGWEMFDAGVACQSFCLAAHSLGLGTVILGIFDGEAIKARLNLPEGESVSALIALGYPRDPAKDAPPRKEVSELLSFI